MKKQEIERLLLKKAVENNFDLEDISVEVEEDLADRVEEGLVDDIHMELIRKGQYDRLQANVTSLIEDSVKASEEEPPQRWAYLTLRKTVDCEVEITAEEYYEIVDMDPEARYLRLMSIFNNSDEGETLLSIEHDDLGEIPDCGDAG